MEINGLTIVLKKSIKAHRKLFKKCLNLRVQRKKSKYDSCISSLAVAMPSVRRGAKWRNCPLWRRIARLITGPADRPGHHDSHLSPCAMLTSTAQALGACKSNQQWLGIALRRLGWHSLPTPTPHHKIPGGKTSTTKPSHWSPLRQPELVTNWGLGRSVWRYT